MSDGMNKRQNNGFLVAPSKITLEFESFLRIFQCLTGCAWIFRGADQAGHKMEVDMQSHPHQIVSINLVAFIKRFLDVRFRNLSKTNASRR